MADEDVGVDAENELVDDLDALEEIIEDDTVETAAAAAITIPGLRPELKKLYQQHPELIVDYIESVVLKIQLKVVQPTDTMPDENHKTYPFLTIYEKTRILGMRANQLSQGARPFVDVPKYVTDVREIARLEVEQKKLPFLVQRTLPNGVKEFWRLSDLMIIH
jgi:DNA-directed RNA polymerase subunit K/omega